VSLCQKPPRLEVLVDYWSGDLPADREDELETHVFGCEACTQRLAGIAAIAHGIARVARRRGGLQMVLTDSLFDLLARSGLRMRKYQAAPGDHVFCTVGPDDDLLVTALTADLAGAERIDVTVFDTQGRILMRFEDAPVEAASGRLIYTIAGDVARTLPPMTLRIELRAVDDDAERTLAHYTFEHRPPQASNR
jgi:hypothetical protein